MWTSALEVSGPEGKALTMESIFDLMEASPYRIVQQARTGGGAVTAEQVLAEQVRC